MQRSTVSDFSGTFWESNVDKKQSARLWGPPESAILSCHMSLKNNNPQHHHPSWDISDISQEFQKPHHPVSGPQGEKKWGPLACGRQGVAVMLVGVLGWALSPATGDIRAGNVVMGAGTGLGIHSIPGFHPLDARCALPQVVTVEICRGCQCPRERRSSFNLASWWMTGQPQPSQTEGKLRLQPVPPLSKLFPTGLRKCVHLGLPWWSSG